ncbi:MAG: TAXI family TRAP transporter solute-binding subunit [Campylobacterota bacterium]|nr:TAXI family TRAP transporter solute-binding subunit [Campylobacterota bacterium]
MTKIFNNISKIWFTILTIFFILFFLTYNLSAPAVKKELTMATGAIGSDSYAYAISYKTLLEQEDVRLNIIPTLGSLDTIGYLHNKKADIGFVHSGILLDKKEYDFESLASVYHEPLWIFYRNDGYGLDYILEFVGKKIGISITNDGTYDLSKKVFETNKIEQHLEVSYIQDEQSFKYLKEKKIDIFITLATKENQYIKELLNDPDIEIMGIKRVDAYKQKFDYLEGLTLYEGSIDLAKNIPSKDTNLLSTTQNLVCNTDTPNELIRIFLKKVQQIHNQKSFFQDSGTFINLEHLDTTINDEAQRYITYGESWLEKIFPYWIASNIDRLKLLIIPLIWLIIPLFKSIIPLYIFTIRSKIFRWYEEIDEINEKLNNKNINSKELLITAKKLETLKEDIESKTKVPLSYRGEYYNLIVHIELLEKKMEQLRKTV